jgi:hypothetical protein
VYLSESSAGSFGKPQKLIGGNQNGQTAVAAAFDGGGFALFNHTGWLSDPGQVTAGGFGALGPTGKKGISGVPGGGNVSCGEVSFGRFEIKSAVGCFLHGTGEKSNYVVTGGELRIDGLRIVPDAGVKIILDPKALTINTTGAVSVMVSNSDVGDVVLWHGEIHRDLSHAAPGTTLFEFPSQLFKANILGFDVASDLPVKLEADGVRIPIDLELPPVFGGFTAHAVLLANASGLKIDSLHIHIGPVPLGVLIVDKVNLDYVSGSSAQSTQGTDWIGEGEVTVPAGGTLDARVEFLMGAFKRASIAFTPVSPIPIGPFVYLLRISGGFAVDPIQIEAGAVLGAGVALNGQAPVKVNGTFTMTFPKHGPADFKLSGTVDVLLFQVGKGYLDFQTDGYAAFGGQVGLDVGPLDLEAKMDGFVDGTTGKFGAGLKGKIELCLDFGVVEPCASGSADSAVSNAGFATCAGFSVLGKHVSGGIEFPWKDFKPIYAINPFALSAAMITHIAIPCSSDAYYVPPPRKQSFLTRLSGGTPITVKPGLPSQTILIEGKRTRPDVTVTGPGGVAIDAKHPNASGFVATAKGIRAQYAVLLKPPAGTWTVTPKPGSPAIKRILLSDGYKPATVRARIVRKRPKVRIRYRISTVDHSQTVTFAETGSFGTRLVKTASQRKGAFSFCPFSQRGGKRTVVAMLQHDGVVVGRTVVGHFTARGPGKAGPVKKLRARRTGRSLVVKWKPARRAASYVVKLRGSRGTRLARLLPRKAHGLRFKAIRRDERFRVTVQAFSKSFRAGPIRKVAVRTG